MRIAFNPSTVEALITPPNNKDITFDLRGRNIFARGVKFCGTDTWRDIKINNVSIGSNILDLRNGSNTTLTNINGVVTINSTWRPVVDNLTSDSTTSSLSANQGRILAELIDGKSNSDHNHDDRYLKLTGGTLTGNLICTAAMFSGRFYENGDDEGIIIKPSSNGYAGLILGAHNGERSVFYLTKGNPFWRYNNGSTNLDIQHPKKPGVIALTSDIPTSLKNPYSLTLQANGTTLATYDGSVSKIVNLTYGNVGAAAKNHTHSSLEPWSSYITGDSHATALKSLFNENKTSIPRNKFISMYSSAYSNGSYYMGYFLQGYENNPYGGFFVAHYDAAYYVGIANGSFSQHRLAYSTDIPNSLKNPHALTISLNGTSQGAYDGSAAKNINITPGSIGAATSDHNHDNRYLKLTGGTMQLGKGLKFHADDNYFGTNADARIISLLDGNDKICDGGLIIDERATLNGTEYVTELLRIRDSEFKWKGSNILHSGNTYVLENEGYINGTQITYVNNANTVDNIHATGFLRWKGMQNIGSNAPFQAVVDIIKDTSKLNDGGLAFYSCAGDEYTVLIGSRNDAMRHGNALKWGYANKYLWMIRMTNGSPRSSDWEKISAGYADLAGSVAWNNVTGKPSSFIPSAHTHTVFNNNLMIKGTNGVSDSASIHLGIGDSDTGFKWISDGKCQIYANNVAVGEWTSGGMNWFKNPTVNGNKVWNAGNDGSGSGLDADLLDGKHASDFVPRYIGTGSVVFTQNSLSNWNGALITTPFTWSNPNTPVMFAFTIRIYENYIYTDIVISGYCYATNHWHAPKCHVIGGDAAYNVKFGWFDTADAAGAKHLYVWFGKGKSNNNNIIKLGHGGFSIMNVHAGHNKIDVYSGWSASNTSQDELVNIQSEQIPDFGKADTATKVIVNQTTTNNANYPLVWSNQNNTNTVTENQLFKSWSDLYYNPKNKRLTVGGSVVASSFVKSGGTSQQLLRADGGIATFNWSGQSGQPTWLWGGNNEHSYYVYNPSNFRVAYATSSGNADTLDGTHLNGIFTAFGNNAHNITATIGGVTKEFQVNYANLAGNADTLDGYHANGSNVAPYGHIPTIESDGVMKVGKYIDFHNDNSGKHDFSTRLQSTGNYGNEVNLPSASGTLALKSDIPTTLPANGGNADTTDGVHITWAGELTSTNHLVAWESDGSALRNINPANVTVGNADTVDGYHANGLLTDLSNSDNGISITVGGTTKSVSNISVNYANSAGNADTAQYLRSLGNQNCQTGRTQNYGDVYSYNTICSNTGSPTDYTSVIGFGRGIGGTVEIAGGWCNTGLYWRSLRDCCDDWYSWRTVLDSSNYTGYVDNYYWANVKISTSSSTTTSPTVSNLTATNSIRMGDILLEHADEINNSDNGNLYLNYRSSGNIGLCQGGGNVGIGTVTPSYKLDVNGNIWCRGALNVGSTLSITDSVINCSSSNISIKSKESGSLLINSREVLSYNSDFINMNNKTSFNWGLGLRTNSIGFTSSTYTTDDVTVLIGILMANSSFQFKPAMDGQLLFLKIGRRYSNTQFQCTAAGCEVVKANSFNVLLARNETKNYFNDSLARIFIYVQLEARWYEFYCG